MLTLNIPWWLWDPVNWWWAKLRWTPKNDRNNTERHKQRGVYKQVTWLELVIDFELATIKF